MRVVDEWNYDSLKVTVFHMNGKYSIKLEEDLLEQTYKFRDGQIESLAALKSILTIEFYNNCKTLFSTMKINRDSLFQSTDEEFEFDEII